VCSVGQYSVGGASACSLCPAGLYGGTVGLTVSACSGNCSAGYVCAAGSTNSTPAPCPGGRYSEAGAGTCKLCPAKSKCAGATGTPAPCSGLGFLCPPESAAEPVAAPFACFSSGSTVAAWVRNGTYDSLVTQPGPPLGAMVVAGLRTGYDVACNGADTTDRLPDGVSDAGLASVALGPAGGALVLANGSVVAVGRSDDMGYFTAQAQGTGLLPTARFTVASCSEWTVME
jgi:hypothetical protein